MKRYLLPLIFFIFFCSFVEAQIQGIDVHENTINSWSSVAGDKTANIRFVYVKATESTYQPYASFSTDIKAALGQQLTVGAYHFATPLFSPAYYQTGYNHSNTVDQEVTNFMSVARNYIGKGFLPPALDVEDQIVSFTLSNGYPADVYVNILTGETYYVQNKQKVELTKQQVFMVAKDLAQWIHTWIAEIYSQSGVLPIVYCNKSYATALSPYFVNGTIPCKLWIADPNNQPGSPDISGWQNWPWVFHQYSSTGSVSGIQGSVDLNFFSGDENAFNTLINGQSQTISLSDLTITAGTQSAVPATVVAGATLTASCSEDNSGDATAGANDVTVWLSSDAILTGSDTYLGKISFPSIAANSNSLINSSTIQIPPGTPAGNYYLFFWADGNQIVPESDETNNFASQIIRVTSSQQSSLTLTLTPLCDAASSKITLNWNNVAGATSYNIYRNGSFYTSIAGNQFSNTNIVAGQSYSYYIIAQIPAGNVTSNTASSTAPNCSTNLPGAFALTLTSACSGNSSQITIGWSTSNNAINYDIYRNNVLYAPGVSGVQFIDNSISAGQTYSYYLIAKNSFGTTASNTQSVTSQNCSVAVLPGTPTLTLTPVCNGSTSQIKLDWTATENTLAYDIYRNHNYYVTVNSGTEYVDQLVTPGLQYLYYVRATNTSGGSNSTAQSATASNCTNLPLPAVPNLSVVASCTGGTSKIILNWTTDINTISYDVYRNFQYYTSVDNGTQFIDYSITTDSAYVYYLEAKNNTGSTDSRVLSARALNCTPNLPGSLVLTSTPSCNGTSAQVILDWTTATNAVAYDVYRDNTLLYTAFYDMREYVDNNVSAGTNHTYYIAASNGSGLTNSNTQAIVIPNCTPPPTVSSITPQTAKIGTQVTISGANFDNTTTVTFGGVPAQSVTLVSPTQVQAVVSTGATGNVVVTNQGGATTFGGFNFQFTLPADNFSILATSATCKGSSDGSIVIAANQVLNYQVSVTGNGLNNSKAFTIADTVNNLSAGTYHICITVPDYPSYQQCYDLVITEPKDLSVYSTVNDLNNTVNLNLSGATTYNISLNGTNYTTNNSYITLPLKEGENQLQVTTDKICQGNFQTIINILKKIIPFPNPFDNTLNINLGPEQINKAVFELHNTGDGKILYSKQFTNQAGVIQLDLSDLREGVYALHIKLDNIERIYKIIKK